jgi:2-dehydropantoate 2-reductase
MGCRFGSALERAGNTVVLLDDWKEHIDAINFDGLRIIDESGEHVLRMEAHLYTSVTEPVDLVIVFAKATQTADVAAAAAGAIGPETMVMTLQNGLGNIEALLQHAPADRLLAGITTFGTELLGPGRIRTLGSGSTLFAALAPTRSDEVEEIRAAFDAAGLVPRVSYDALGAIWSKVAFNCVLNALCTLTSSPVSALANYPGFDTLAANIVGEAAAVAAREGVSLDQVATLQLIREQFDPGASGNHLPSMLQDMLNGRPTEIDHLNGAIGERATRYGLAAPNNRLIAQIIRLLEATRDSRIEAL